MVQAVFLQGLTLNLSPMAQSPCLMGLCPYQMGESTPWKNSNLRLLLP